MHRVKNLHVFRQNHKIIFEAGQLLEIEVVFYLCNRVVFFLVTQNLGVKGGTQTSIRPFSNFYNIGKIKNII